MSTLPARAAGGPVAALDADLAEAVRKTSHMRQAFYVVVLVVALWGQVSGAKEALHINAWEAAPAVGALELGGIVVLANADVRRRLGEHALASRVLSAAIAAGAVGFNWLAHHNHLQGGFFAGMSGLGYLVWLMHTGNQRRDRLRALGDLPPTTPGYEVFGHWLRHPLLTARAKSLAKAAPALGLYGSLDAARTEARTTARNTAIAKVLHRKIRAAVDPTTADIAVAVYDLDEIAARLAAAADYDGLTALVAADLIPDRLVAAQDDTPTPPPPAPASPASPSRTTDVEPPAPARPRLARTASAGTPGRKGQSSTADRVAKALARTPAATPAEIAARLSVSERTVQRHLKQPAIAGPQAPVVTGADAAATTLDLIPADRREETTAELQLLARH